MIEVFSVNPDVLLNGRLAPGAPFMFQIKDRWIVQLRSDKRVQLMQKGQKPKQPAAARGQDEHRLNDASIRTFRNHPRKTAADDRPK